jgi:hypothetical protein
MMSDCCPIVARIRLLLLALILALVMSPWVDAQKTVHVKPYTKKDGTQVKGHDRRAPTAKDATETPTTTATAAKNSSDSAEAATSEELAPAELGRPTSATLTGQSSQLLGFTGDRVRELLGMPSLISNGAWNYDRGQRTLHVYFKAGVVSEVRLMDVDLATFALPEVQLGATAKAPPPSAPPSPPPNAAVAQCGDGLFVYIATGGKTCAGHGGAAEWLK